MRKINKDEEKAETNEPNCISNENISHYRESITKANTAEDRI